MIEKAKKHKKGKIDHGVYFKERGTIRDMIKAGEIQEAKKYLQENIPELYNTRILIRGLLDALEFLRLIEIGDLMMALDFS